MIIIKNMFLLHAGSSYDLKQNKDVTFIGYKVRNILNGKGIEIIRYYSDNQEDDIFYKEIEYKLDLTSEKWEKRIFQLTKEEIQEELKDVPSSQKIY